ncbi:MAG: nucleoside phosphorylase, partial [Bacteroidales bacterium]|nr:nucleoside phosphorylase [Bacteroidales bacterium]
MKRLKESELILNPDGSLYHLLLRPEHLAGKIILVGDPQRVPLVSSFFDKVEFKFENREIITHTGYLNNVRLTVMSTGMGPDNIDIVMNELDALVNVDLNTRTIKEKHTSLDIVRLGTSGALQADIPIDSFAMATHGLGIDGLLHFYKHGDISDDKMAGAFEKQVRWPKALPAPYAVKGSESLEAMLGEGFIKGITITAPGFYGPQGREIRLKAAYPEMNERISAFRYNDQRIINFEMETSALYAFGKMLGHNTLTVCSILANRINETYSQNPKEATLKLIRLLLGKLSG